jgi:16S rRNA (cytidine1402-2'-O)-methyltransferase
MLHTLVSYESPFRVHKFLVTAFEVFDNQMSAVCIQLRKKIEQVHRGLLGELCRQFEDKNVRGEISVVIAGINPKFTFDEKDEGELPDTDKAP